MSGFVRDERGQALIVVAAAITLLLGAVAFGIDWGYGLVQRRAMQNAADAGTLAAGRELVRSFAVSRGSPTFERTAEEVWCTAHTFALANRGLGVPPEAVSLRLEFRNNAGTTLLELGGSPPDCTGAGVTPVPPQTVVLRGTTRVSVRSLVGAVVGQREIVAGASARVRLSGAPYQPGPAATVVRHYEAADFESTDRSVVLWSPSDDDVAHGGFKGLVDLSRYSTQLTGRVEQLMTDWDRSGPQPDRSGRCPGGRWDPQGGNDKQCDVPNYTYYGFRGRLSLDTDWSTAAQLATRPGQQAPSALPVTRRVCTSDAPEPPPPSCTASRGALSTAGDWLETRRGGVARDLTRSLAELIRDHGTELRYSAQYGPGIVLSVYLWDCAEERVGGAWQLIVPASGDCSDAGPATAVDRVHLFTVAPFEVYRDLLSANEVRGFWGGYFGDPNVCIGCPLSPVANAASLVPDE